MVNQDVGLKRKKENKEGLLVHTFIREYYNKVFFDYVVFFTTTQPRPRFNIEPIIVVSTKSLMKASLLPKPKTHAVGKLERRLHLHKQSKGCKNLCPTKPKVI